MLTVRTSENTVITSFRLISERQDFSSVRTAENTVRARARIQADPLRLLEVVALNIEKDLKGLTLGFEERKAKVAMLTPREAQVIKKVLMGLSNKETGESLGLSERTVENHRAAAYKKLAVSSADELKDFSYFI